jgi:hypothetical protein
MVDVTWQENIKKETSIENFLKLGCNKWRYEYERGLKLYYRSLRSLKKNEKV